MKLFDMSGKHVNPPVDRNHYRIDRKTGKVLVRKKEQIDSIVLHQTACDFVAGHALLKKAKYDAIQAMILRAMRVHCHYVVLEGGDVVQVCPDLWYVYHANCLNSRSIGIEIEGLYSGVGSGELAFDVRDAAIRMIGHIKENFPQIKYLFAHRQSSGSRRADPGEEIWGSVALQAEREIDIKTMPTFRCGTGRPVPIEWDRKNGKGKF